MTRNPKTVDPRDVGTYSVAEAGRYLRIPAATLRSWICGRRYPTKQQERFWPAVIALTDEELAIEEAIRCELPQAA